MYHIPKPTLIYHNSYCHRLMLLCTGVKQQLGSWRLFGRRLPMTKNMYSTINCIDGQLCKIQVCLSRSTFSKSCLVLFVLLYIILRLTLCLESCFGDWIPCPQIKTCRVQPPKRRLKKGVEWCHNYRYINTQSSRNFSHYLAEFLK
jgi:hypothetical protein